ncbi:MAG TPA: Rrf2 family transcriptional regulator [Acidobacteriota bacterium]|nr:Rrf2 family transcriptional regulator [Acidobacteriota bacterium]
MITATTELAIRWLVYLAVAGDENPTSPRRGAGALHCSPSYLAKTSSLLVKAGILRSIRGIRGGVVFARHPEEISLLHVVEACQGLLTARYCGEADQKTEVCSYHSAMKEVHEATTQALSRWTIKDLLENPARCPEEGPTDCRMYFEDCQKVRSAIRKHCIPSRA